jgi:hypothetical protein
VSDGCELCASIHLKLTLLSTCPIAIGASTDGTFYDSSSSCIAYRSKDKCLRVKVVHRGGIWSNVLAVDGACLVEKVLDTLLFSNVSACPKDDSYL